jgi:hypothetical protein
MLYTNDDDDSQYATGWFVTKDNQETLIYHPGTLENYSSYIMYCTVSICCP